MTMIILNMTRLNYIDAIAGLLIIRMILGHIFQRIDYEDCAFYLNMRLYFSFFMPWFFYKAGMFAKNDICLSIRQLKKWGGRILVPYMAFSILGLLILYITSLLEVRDYVWYKFLLGPFVTFLKYGAVSGNLALWFLLTLFFAYVSFYYVLNKGIRQEYIFAGTILLAYTLFLVGFRYPATISSTLIGTAFFALGYLLKDEQFDTKAISLSIIVGLVLIICKPSIVDVCSNTLLQGDYVTWVLYSMSAIILINNIFKRIPYNFPVLSYIGRNAITFFASHWIYLIVIEAILKILCIEDKMDLLLIYIISLAILLPFTSYIFNRPKLKFLIGKF